MAEPLGGASSGPRRPHAIRESAAAAITSAAVNFGAVTGNCGLQSEGSYGRSPG